MKGFKTKLEKAMKENKKVKIIFEYPNSKSAKIRRGYVKSVSDDSFELDEIKDGEVTYSYKYIVEIQC